MLILGLETSCDETAAALVKDGTEIISQTTASSEELHKKTGGIVPEVAAREQVCCIIPVVEETLASASVKPEGVDAVAVTYGPGLIGSLLVGVETAKSLAYVWKKPLIPINHLIGHIYANFLDWKWEVGNGKWEGRNRKVVFPAMCLVVSGGHTELVLMKNHGDWKWIGGTRDDAAGECFDKAARLLGLGYPGGPAIARVADKLLSHRRSERSEKSFSLSETSSEILRLKPQNDNSGEKFFNLPRPMIDSDDYDFSFSGLKTAVINFVRHPDPPEAGKDLLKTGGDSSVPFGKLRVLQNDSSFISQIAYEFQEAVTDVLVEKTLKAARDFKVKSILLSGGVAANQRLRERFGKYARNFAVFIPPVKLCTDNAAIIASTAFFNYKPIFWKKITADPGLGLV